MVELTQEQLLTCIDAAYTFFDRVTGHVPTTKQVQALLAVAGIHETLESIKTNTHIVLELNLKEESE
jgi:hypothetical protein